MKVIKEATQLREYLRGRSNIGFIPTMGSLHEGHLSLVTEIEKHCSFIVVSIFVNPLQFSKNEDFDTYPSQIEKDIEALKSIRTVDVLFLPEATEIYPNYKSSDFAHSYGTKITNNELGNLLEGRSRPHFFTGVLTVVSKLINIVEPNYLILGQKDIQQYLIVKQMIKDFCYKTKLVIGETKRNYNGLAQSSRNSYLNKEELELAEKINKALKTGADLFSEKEFKSTEIIKSVLQSLPKEIEVDYVSIVDKASLKDVAVITDEGAILLCAVKIGKVRLIDNMLLGVELHEL